MRRIAVAIVGLVMVLATMAAALPSSGSQAATPLPYAPPGSDFSTAPGPVVSPAPGPVVSASPDSDSAAVQFATQVLSEAPIPPGAQLWTAAAPAALTAPFVSIGVSGLTDLDALYQVNEQAGQALQSYVLAGLPQGSTVGTAGNGFGPAGSWIGFVVSLPTSGPNESEAQLLYATTQLADGSYVLRIDAQVVWVPDAAPSDALPPPGSAVLTGYTTISMAGPPSGSLTVDLGETDSARLANAINTLPLAAAMGCMEASALYTITFHPASGSGPTDVAVGGTCGRAVDVTVGATRLPARSDQGCTVLRLVAGFLPAAAAGTRSLLAEC